MRRGREGGGGGGGGGGEVKKEKKKGDVVVGEIKFGDGDESSGGGMFSFADYLCVCACLAGFS